MPTTVAGVSASTATTNVALTTGSFTPVTGDLLVAIAVTTGQAGGGLFTDSLSLGWFASTTVLFNTSADSLVLAIANMLVPKGQAMTVTFTPAGAPTDTGVAISVLRVSGNNLPFGAAAVRQVSTQANGAAAGTPAPVFATAPLTGNTLIGAVGNRTNPATMTAPVAFTSPGEVHDIGYATAVAGLETAGQDGGITAATTTWGSTSATAFGAFVLELATLAAPAGGGGGAVAYVPNKHTNRNPDRRHGRRYAQP